MKDQGKDLGLVAELEDLTMLPLWIQGCGLVLTRYHDCLAVKGMDPKYKVCDSELQFFFFLILSAELQNRIFLYFQLFFK